MQIPAELQVVIGLFITYLVTNGLKALSELLGKDLSGYATVVVGILVASVVFFFNQILAIVPPGQTQQIVTAIMNLLVLLLGAMGVKRFEVKTLRAR